MKTLILYSRPGCHLCELLLEQLSPLLGSDVVVNEIDISTDPQLARRYGLRIPVLAGDSGELSGYPLDEGRVLGYLRN